MQSRDRAAQSRGDLPLVLRHHAIFASAVAAILLRKSLHVGMDVAWLLAFAGLANFLCYLASFGRSARLASIARASSPCIGVASWAALVLATGGIGSSPFVAGLWLEIVLAAMTRSQRAIRVVTLLDVVAVWALELPREDQHSLVSTAFQSAFLAVFGAVVSVVHERWRATHDELEESFSEQCDRLRELERELADHRTLETLGAHSARLAHGLKNAVHSLRGFARLIELSDTRRTRDASALDGLRRTIDQLETLARTTMGRDESSRKEDRSGAPDVRRAIEEALGDVSLAHPSITCRTDLELSPHEISVAPAVLREVLDNLLLNAAEAMQGHGVVSVEARTRDRELEIRVLDRGSGLSEENIPKLFRPGFTTKPRGSGLGLYLVRRLVESQRGRVAALPGAGGTTFSVVFPIREER